VGLIVLTVWLSGRLVVTALAQGQDWESSIERFEEQDKVNPPKFGGIVFTGSSSIARWDTLVDEMKPLDVINPVMNQRIDWPWFVISQIAFGVVAGIVVSRQERIATWQPLPLAVREGVEAQGAPDEEDGGDVR
jgi:hypothetical protein